MKLLFVFNVSGWDFHDINFNQLFQNNSKWHQIDEKPLIKCFLNNILKVQNSSYLLWLAGHLLMFIKITGIYLLLLKYQKFVKMQNILEQIINIWEGCDKE
jgi:hypothetical protein